MMKHGSILGVLVSMVLFVSWQYQNKEFFASFQELSKWNTTRSLGADSSTAILQSRAAALTETREFGPGCPAAAIQNRGIYANRTNSTLWDNVLLMTASNTGYHDMLQNWEYLAREHGLKWAVAAFDHEVYEKLGPNRSFPTKAHLAITEASSYRQPGFNVMTCNKFRMVLHVLNECEMDVVFADSDAVFLKDPFAHDMGDLIQTGDYDYIYQINFGESPTPRTYIAMGPGSSRPEREYMKEGNTGFHYLSHKSSLLKTVIEETLTRCARPGNKIDDQTLFWSRLRKRPLRLCHESKVGSPFLLNDEAKYHNITEGDGIASLCYLDPYYYPIGKKPFQEQMQKDMVVYHANFVRGKPAKIAKLRNDTYLGYGWNDSRISL